MDKWMEEEEEEEEEMDGWMGEREKERERESWRELMSRVQQQLGSECQWGSLYFFGQEVFIFEMDGGEGGGRRRGGGDGWMDG